MPAAISFVREQTGSGKIILGGESISTIGNFAALSTDLEEDFFVDNVSKIVQFAPCIVPDLEAATGAPLDASLGAFFLQLGIYSIGGPGWEGPTGNLARLCAIAGEPLCSIFAYQGSGEAISS